MGGERFSSAASTSILICAATVIMGTTGSLLLSRQRKSTKDSDENDKTTTHELFGKDVLFYKFDIPPITTVTWFKGNYQDAKLVLERRMKKIMMKNPWLRGRISTSGLFKGKCTLSYKKQRSSSTNEDDDIDMMNVDEYVTTIDPKLSPISYDMPLSTQNNTLLRSSIYLSDIFLKNGPNEPFIRVTLVPCATNPNESFAYQLSHTAGDGATYYKLMEMLCSEDKDEDDNDTNIVELIPERIKESKKMQIDILGATEENFLTSFGFSLLTVLDLIKNQLKGHIPVEYAFIDPVHVESLKQSSSGKVGSSGVVVPYVSTNDILTSHILTKSKSVYGMMAINWRNRLEGHTTLHAGNYENFIFYRKQDAIAPELIRKSLLDGKYKRAVTKDMTFPSWYEVVNTTFSCVTNWSTFAKPNVIGNRVEDVHFPLILAEAVPSHKLRMFIIFRSGRDNKIGICYPRGMIDVNPDSNDPFGLMK